jgi:hypothetical protein
VAQDETSPFPLNRREQLSGFRRLPFHRLNEPNLVSINDFEPALFIIKKNGLLIRANHQVIGMRNHKGLLIAEHNPNWSKRLGVHQFFDFIRDHCLNLAALGSEDNSVFHCFPAPLI